MKTAIVLIATWLVAALAARADGPGVFVSRHSKADFALTADPNAKSWKNITAVFAENGPRGEAVPGHKTEIRSRWTDRNLYLLFICPYETLHLHPNPSTTTETNKLWDWDVAEAFIGSDLNNIRRYKEFEVSPQSEWVDLDIDFGQPRMKADWQWNSGWKVKARIDEAKKIWYAEMQIPMESIGAANPKPGQEMRINLYRCQGPPSDRKYIAWQPTKSRSFHVPESFGRLKLEK